MATFFLTTCRIKNLGSSLHWRFFFKHTTAPFLAVVVSPISEIFSQLVAQLVIISAHSSVRPTKWVWMLSGRSFEKKILWKNVCEVCWAHAFLSAAFAHHTLMATSWQQRPVSSSALEWQPLLSSRSLSLQLLCASAGHLRPASQVFNPGSWQRPHVFEASCEYPPPD